MYLRLFILLCLLVAINPRLYAQNSISVSGFIRDSSSLESLYNATVYEINSERGTISNTYGFYSITVPSGDINLTVSFVGYEHQMISIKALKDTIVNFHLLQKNDLQEVTIKAQSLQQKQTFSGHEQVSMQSIKSLPAFVGEQDVLKSLTMLPGVQQGYEGSAGLFVRGGSPDQNLMLLDGVPIFNATHMFGFISVFTPEALQSVDLYKGGFPARYGGRLSSVVDVRMKEGNKTKSATDLMFGLVTSKYTHEGPIKKEKSSFLISARRTLLDLLARGGLKIVQSSDDQVIMPKLHLYDVNAKFNFELNETNRLYLSFYGGGDCLASHFKDTYSYQGGETKQKTKVNLKWGNKVGSLRWSSRLNNRLFLNTTLSSGTFNYTIDNRYYQSVTQDNDTEIIWTSIEYLTRVNNDKLQLLFDWYLPEHKLQFGASGELNHFVPGRQKIKRHDGDNLERGKDHSNNTALSCFFDDQYAINERLTLYGGLRLDVFDLEGKWSSQLTPRINAKYALRDNCNLFVSYARMTQPLHLLTNSSIGLPSDIWVPATKKVAPEISHQVTAGAEVRLSNQLHYKFDSYYKAMDNVINYQAGNSFMDIFDDWEELVEVGTGKAWGIENSINYESSRLKSWLNYTLAWNKRKFASLNKGKYFPFKFDRRHDINLGCVYQLNDHIECSAVWTFQTGLAATVPMRYYNAAGPIDYEVMDFVTGLDIKNTERIQLFEKYNDYRLPAFHHLDVGLTFKKQREKSYREWKVGIYNVYARQNAYMFYPDVTPEGETIYKKVCLFPFVPSVSYRISF
ncbi:TonB-dependent receptor [Puteibacter caeruleilacunae]|nr:TonB-dependent receptor [Puteibacter caeruleilacunae]